MTGSTFTEAELKERITAAVSAQGLNVRSWRQGEDGLEAVLGTFRVIEPDEDRGLYEDSEGLLVAEVVGAVEYRNVRVHFSLHEEGMDMGTEVRDLSTIEEV